MPKRNRDLEDDALDKEELKAMLEQSLDDQAKLQRENDQLKEEKKQLQDNLRKEKALGLYRAFPFIPKNSQGRYVNPRLPALLSPKMLEQDVFELKTKIWKFSVDSCDEVVDILSNGVKAGMRLRHQGSATDAAITPPFEMHVLCGEVKISEGPFINNQYVEVVEDEKNQFTVVGASSTCGTHLPLYQHLYGELFFDESAWLARYLESDAGFVHGHQNKSYSAYIDGCAIADDDVVERINKQPYNGKVEGILIATDEDEDTAKRYDVDLNRSIATCRKRGKVHTLSWPPRFDN